MAKKLARKKSHPKAQSPKPKAGRAREGSGGARQGKYVYFFGRKTDGNGIDEAAARRQGREPRRDDPHRPAGAARLHHHHRGLHLLLRQQADVSAGAPAQMEAGVAALEKQTGTKFGDPKNPLLVSVRSGARDSMPGMMDTILNLGLNDQTVEALATKTGNARFAWDCYRRFVQMYGDVVLGVQKRAGRGSRSVRDGDPRPQARALSRGHRRHRADRRRPARNWSTRFKALVKERTGKEFPNSPWDQLRGAVGAVFGSWMNDRAIVYRRKYNIPTEWGTAVNVQAMVYGNTGDDSGSGVAFTRNPANGVNEFYGEFLINAQGEDVVAGVRTPEPVAELKKQMPKAYAELERIRQTLEKHFKDVQDFEFTIQDGKLFMLQTRNGKRTALAALKFSVDMVKEKLIDWKTAVAAQSRRPARPAARAGLRRGAKSAKAKAIATGLPAGPGAASGKIYLNADRAVDGRRARARRCCSSASRPRPKICAA